MTILLQVKDRHYQMIELYAFSDVEKWCVFFINGYEVDVNYDEVFDVVKFFDAVEKQIGVRFAMDDQQKWDEVCEDLIQRFWDNDIFLSDMKAEKKVTE